MRVLDGKPPVSRSDLDVMLKDLTMTKILRHFIEGVKLLHPSKFENEPLCLRAFVAKKVY
jgi:hypothetical protein